MSFLSFRITHPSFELDPLYKNALPEHVDKLCNYYILNVKNYLKRLGYDIVEYVAGIHLEAVAPHLHIHYLVNTGESHIPRVFIQHWKYTFTSGKVQVESPNGKDKFPCLVSYKHGKKVNISIKFTKEAKKEEIDSFLGYPLKEGIFVSSDLDEMKIKCLSSQAQGVWNAVKIKKLKDQQRDENAASEYGKICAIISSNTPDSYQDAVRIVLEELKKTRVEQKEHVNPQFIIKSVQKYCYHSGIWSIDEIMDKYA